MTPTDALAKLRDHIELTRRGEPVRPELAEALETLRATLAVHEHLDRFYQGERAMKNGWTKIGVVGVDAGLIWLGDPCYILHKDADRAYEAIGKSWREFCDRLHKGGQHATQFHYDAGHPGLGVCVDSGLGDGEYEVLARIVDVPGLGKRVAEVRIVFIDEKEMASS